MSTSTKARTNGAAIPILHPLPPGLARALNHDLRVRILDLMARDVEPISPNLVSMALREPLGNVSYHMKVLLKDCGAIELVRTEPRRGAVEHFYQRTDQMVKWHTDQDVLTTIATVIGDDDLDDGERLQAIHALVSIAGREVTANG